MYDAKYLQYIFNILKFSNIVERLLNKNPQPKINTISCQSVCNNMTGESSETFKIIIDTNPTPQSVFAKNRKLSRI